MEYSCILITHHDYMVTSFTSHKQNIIYCDLEGALLNRCHSYRFLRLEQGIFFHLEEQFRPDLHATAITIHLLI